MIARNIITRFLDDGAWHTARETWLAYLEDLESSISFKAFSRELSTMAEETDALIGGSKGYKRADLATEEELEHAGRSLLSRGRKVARRGLEHLRQAKALREVPGPLFANVRR